MILRLNTKYLKNLLKFFSLFIFILNITKLPVKCVLLDELPDEIIVLHIAKYFPHHDAVRTFSRVSSKFSVLFRQDWTWRKTVIEQSRPKELDFLFKAILANPSLPIKELHIRNMTLDSNQLIELSKWISSDKEKSLKSLIIEGCKLNFESKPCDAYDIFTKNFELLLQKDSQLKELSFNKTSPISYSFLSSLINALRVNKTIKKISFDEIFVGDFPGTLPSHIYENLICNSALRVFSFRKNKVTVSFNDNPVDLMKKLNQESPTLRCIYDGLSIIPVF